MERVVDKATGELSQGRPEAAFATLRPLLRYPQDHAPTELVALLRPLRDIAGALEPGVAPALSALIDDPDDVQRLYDAARALYAHDVVEVAAMLLGRANRLMPGRSSIVSELCATLGADLRHPEALTVLAQSGLATRDAFCRYLTAYHRLMTGDRSGAARARADVGRADDEVLARALARLDGMLARAAAIEGDATTLDRVDLIGWHAVLDGGLLLHELRAGFAMNGRAGRLEDSTGLVRAGIEAVANLAEASGRDIGHVCPAPDRDSQILGLALAERLDRPVLRPADHLRDGIVVVYDVARTGDPGLLSALGHHGGNWWWVHAASWSRPGPRSPDLVTVLHQQVVPPWSDDPRPNELVASELITAPPLASRRASSIPAALARATRGLAEDVTLGVHRTRGPRRSPVRGSPVPSERLPSGAGSGLRTWI